MRGDLEAMDDLLVFAEKALVTGDVPVAAAVIDPDGYVIARATHTKERESDPTAHAEVLALRAAGKALGLSNLHGHTLIVTLEPCVMCAGAITQARITTLVFGAWDDKAGAAGSKHDLVRDRSLPHRVDEVRGGVREKECAQLLRDFFAQK